MTDSNDAPPSTPESEDDDVAARVAVLEQIARDTATTLGEIRDDIRGMRSEMRAEVQGLRGELHDEMRSLRDGIRDLQRVQRNDSRLLFGIVLAVLISQAALWQRLGQIEGQLTAIGTQAAEIASMLRQLPR
jgi:BMFP domain-containing protein YqiC